MTRWAVSREDGQLPQKVMGKTWRMSREPGPSNGSLRGDKAVPHLPEKENRGGGGGQSGQSSAGRGEDVYLILSHVEPLKYFE